MKIEDDIDQAICRFNNQDFLIKSECLFESAVELASYKHKLFFIDDLSNFFRITPDLEFKTVFEAFQNIAQGECFKGISSSLLSEDTIAINQNIWLRCCWEEEVHELMNYFRKFISNVSFERLKATILYEVPLKNVSLEPLLNEIQILEELYIVSNKGNPTRCHSEACDMLYSYAYFSSSSSNDEERIRSMAFFWTSLFCRGDKDIQKALKKWYFFNSQLYVHCEAYWVPGGLLMR